MAEDMGVILDPHQVDDDLDHPIPGQVHRGQQIELIKSLFDEAGYPAQPRVQGHTGWSPRGHTGTTSETRASMSASGRGGHPGTYVDTGITVSTPLVTQYESQ